MATTILNAVITLASVHFVAGQRLSLDHYRTQGPVPGPGPGTGP